MTIAQRLDQIRSSIPEYVNLVAVSKTKPVSDLMEAYQAGHRVFGENKVQEMVEKETEMPKDVEWHMIGHVQRNKVKYMASFVSMIHALDSIRLLEEINKQAMKHDRVINCLLQIKIATEDSKFGMTKNEAQSLLNSEAYSECANVNIVGLMGMATFTDNKEQLKSEFDYLKKCYLDFKKEQPIFNTLSMGMSSDYEIAIASGSNMIRVGSSIFGSRN
ncbi:MAG: YggS family pyridoxal phosphate-dependent enzyme [Bacteroidia bacterium]|nr:YggS family pyridoxal phosphate-dependent enzyme [Bacteroidia bacterium]NND11727.1 YggS family pyridoxal phosphate-dependent enzyme [Flavobacteriaceae bacterium]NNK28486.1 YggS family pyridoxal phosphate-dependent enzyme [Flavobacteriaceae bacterium]RZV66260.1 MAG: YggS family pyridoxal phosphate-dependent enzyme [Flavobacteriaceae bacterium]